MFFTLWIALVGCGERPVTGRVVDSSGQGLDGVHIQIANTTCSAQSDVQGAYTMQCAAGDWTLQYEKPGFLNAQTAFDASHEHNGQIPEQSLIAIPSAIGLFIDKGGRYQPLPTGELLRSMNNDGGKLERRYCLQPTEREATVLPPNLKLYDYKSNPWRLFLLDADQCAYTDTRSASGRWAVGYRNKPDVETQVLGEGLTLSSGTLAPGQYFIAYWDGFFVPTAEGSSTYNGHWFRVDG